MALNDIGNFEEEKEMHEMQRLKRERERERERDFHMAVCVIRGKGTSKIRGGI